MPNFLSPRFSTLRRALMASTDRMNGTTSRLNPSSKSTVNNFNTVLLHFNPPKILPHYCRPRFDVGFGLFSSSMRSNSYCTASENKGDTKPDLDLTLMFSKAGMTTVLTVAIADISSRVPFTLASKVCQYFEVSVGPNVNGILQVGTCCIGTSVLFGVIFFVTRLYQPIPKDLFYWGSIMGLSYLQTRNLLTPIAIHSLFNTILISYSMSK